MQGWLSVWGRRLLLLVLPLLLVILEWNHPRGFSNDVFGGLIGMGSHWQYLHIYQALLFGGVAVGGMLLTWRINTFWGVVSKLSLWVFAVAYLVFDSTAGISVGFILQASQENPQMHLETIKALVQLLYTDPLIGGTGSFFSLLGSWAWLLGIGTAIIAIWHDNRDLPSWKIAPPLFLLAVSAYALFVGHFSPYGPVAFGSLALASLWFEIFHFGPAADEAVV